jgi:hypothetical protein
LATIDAANADAAAAAIGFPIIIHKKVVNKINNIFFFKLKIKLKP